MQRNFLTLDEFTIQQLRLFPNGTGELSALLRDIGLASKRINVEIGKAGLQDILGSTNTVNVQGETVQKLDNFANNQLIGVLRNGVSCAGICSEEEEDIIVFDDDISNNSKYVVVFDPLDGSSNIDNNISIGTIFGIYRRVSQIGTPCTKEDFLQTGRKLVAAGYIIYGSSTMFVYATRRGVNGFTLDPSIGEYCLSHPNIKSVGHGVYYSVNMAGLLNYSTSIQLFIKQLMQDNFSGKNKYNFRYVGSMVADLHRNLINGGIFMYPGTPEKPEGKLRLLYECIPFAFIYRVAGGRTSNGLIDMLDVQPTTYHARSPLFIGTNGLMDMLETFNA